MMGFRSGFDGFVVSLAGSLNPILHTAETGLYETKLASVDLWRVLEKFICISDKMKLT